MGCKYEFKLQYAVCSMQQYAFCTCRISYMLFAVEMLKEQNRHFLTSRDVTETSVVYL